ncbi:hypothetical protein N9351_00450 [Candidatus Thioglobus sp.]|nr:hypothetical protein [Candidatus Thioglobus sp.]
MKQITKILAMSGIILSTNVFSVTETYKITLKQTDLCTDWECTTPFTAFTGSNLVSITSAGVAPGSNIDLVIPSSGIYSHIRQKLSLDFQLSGYKQRDDGSDKWCASGVYTSYDTSAEAAAVNTLVTAALPSDFFRTDTFKSPATAEKGMVFYGSRADQTSVSGYVAKDSTSDGNTSDNNPYTMILTPSGASDFYITTVLQGDFDFSSAMLPTTVTLGIKLSGVQGGLDADLIGGNCTIQPGEPIFDYIIQ